MKFKGHTKIELTNVETGEVKVYEDDNMLTNYIAKVFDFAAKHALGNFPWNVYGTGHWYNLLGSIVLFDSALTENADKFWLPAGVKPVGYGMQGDTNSYTDYSEWGIYNTQESDTSQTDTKKMVWDFATSHANGTIASVALTHFNNGLFGFGTPSFHNTQRWYYNKMSVGTCFAQSSKGKQGRNDGKIGSVGSNLSFNDGSYLNFCVDSDNDVKYMFKVCQDGLSIIKHNLYPEKLDLFRGSQRFQSYVEETYSETFSGSYFSCFYNSDEKMLYFWTLSETRYFAQNSITLSINKFDMENKVLTKGWKSATLTGSAGIYLGIVVTDTALYYVADASSGRSIKKLEFSGGTTSVLTTRNDINGQGSMPGHNFLMNGIIYFDALIVSSSTSYYDVLVDTSDDTVRITNSLGAYSSSDFNRHQFVPPIDNTQVIFGTNLNVGEAFNGYYTSLDATGTENFNSGNMFATTHYLGTINNLSEPIVKTAQQTMKVTYTITAEE